MRRLLPITLLLSIATISQAQTIVPTSASATFPGCALACTSLLQAQSLCLSQIPASGTQLARDNCFCQSAYLQAFYATPDSVCAAECTIESDRQELQAWFVGFCREVGTGVDPISGSSTAAAAATSTGTGTPTTLQTSTTTGTPTPTITIGNVSSGSSGNDTSSGSAWFSTHWKWVVMIIVLAVGLSLLAIIAIFLKKRHRKKVEARKATMSGFPATEEKRTGKARAVTPDLWGPHQHMHATQGYRYEYNNAPAGGVLGKSTVEESTREVRSSDKRSRRHSRRKSTDRRRRDDR